MPKKLPCLVCLLKIFLHTFSFHVAKCNDAANLPACKLSGDMKCKSNQRMSEDVESLRSPTDLLPLHRWSEEPKERRLLLSDNTNVTLRLLHAQSPRLFEVDGLLSATEADEIIGLARGNLVAGEAADFIRPDMRKAKVAFFAHNRSRTVQAVNSRVADLTRVPLANWVDTELLSVSMYHKNGYYHGHDDSVEFRSVNGAEDFPISFLPGGARFITILVFLNHVEGGGETLFPLAGWTRKEQRKWRVQHRKESLKPRSIQSEPCDLQKKGLKIRPQPGKAILWYNHGVTPKGELGDYDLGAWWSLRAVVHSGPEACWMQGNSRGEMDTEPMDPGAISRRWRCTIFSS